MVISIQGHEILVLDIKGCSRHDGREDSRMRMGFLIKNLDGVSSMLPRPKKHVVLLGEGQWKDGVTDTGRGRAVGGASRTPDMNGS